MDNFSFFVFKIFPAGILLFGFIGNTTGFIVLSSKNLKKLGTRNMYKYLLVSDTLYLSQLIILYMQFGYGGVYDLTITSSLFCKIFNFLNYSMATISPMLTIYISIERYIAATYPSKRFLFKKNRNQLIYILIVILYLGAFYLVYPFYYDVILSGSGNDSYLSCNFIDSSSHSVLSYLFLANSALMPFIIMIIFTTLLCYTIFKSRNRIQANHSQEENKTFKRDLKFTITSIGLNLIFIALNLPVSLAILVPDYQQSIVFVFSYFLFYLSYGVNFYILLVFNSIIRTEFINLFKFKFIMSTRRINIYQGTIESSRQNANAKSSLETAL